MKIFLFLFTILSLLYSFGHHISQPPSFPHIHLNDKKVKEDPCSNIPPMLYNIPNELLILVDKCTSYRVKPTKKYIKKRLEKNGYGKNIEIISIKELEQFPRIYKIVFTKRYFFDLVKVDRYIFCDWKIDICFKSKPYILK